VRSFEAPALSALTDRQRAPMEGGGEEEEEEEEEEEWEAWDFGEKTPRHGAKRGNEGDEGDALIWEFGIACCTSQ